jgi:NAD(P)-dependent dehydrogenase (short-subunit alcohol dehydrogenase family)
LSEIERLVAEVKKHTDHVDILFANAGATWGSEFEKVDEKNGWDKVMDLNVKGVFFTIQKSVPSHRHACSLTNHPGSHHSSPRNRPSKTLPVS